jgi:tetraacyldisaccharide 4'-kinase
MCKFRVSNVIDIIVLRILQFLLLPFSLLYGLITFLRNYAYDQGWLKSTSFPFPVVVVGNLTVGGTGKTPHIEYLIRLFSANGLQVGTLSRGYKRKSRGFLFVEQGTPVSQTGDEPKQIKLHFPNAHVAVCENRVEGITKLKQAFPNIDVVLLDDAFQHRRVKPGFSIVLSDYRRPPWSDFLLPAGRLREGVRALKRADAVVVSKTPSLLSSSEQDELRKRWARLHNGKIDFSTLVYGQLYHLFQVDQKRNLDELSGTVFLVTALASPKVIVDELESRDLNVKPFTFPDHYDYGQEDVDRLIKTYQQSDAPSKCILTTAKDAVKLIAFNFGDRVPVYVLPIEVNFPFSDQFDKRLLEYVRRV